VLLLAAVTSIGLASCTLPSVAVAVPQTIVNIPGSATITTRADLGNPAGTLVLCSTVRTSVLIQASSPFFTPYSGNLSWNKATVPIAANPDNEDFANTAAFGPVDPGCGQYRAALFFDFSGGGPYTGPSSITFSFTTCDPNASLDACLATVP
jgi:hypothetical protein